jgi:hypothetical protein
MAKGLGGRNVCRNFDGTRFLGSQPKPTGRPSNGGSTTYADGRTCTIRVPVVTIKKKRRHPPSTGPAE